MKRIVISVVLAVVVVLAILMLVLPSKTHLERSVTINAPVDVVFPQANDLRTFHQWSPWTPRDPNAEYDFSDPSVGTGARMSWKGNDQVGEGSLTIMKSAKNETIETDLDFGPQGKASSAWIFEPISDDQTKVVWTFDTDHGWNPLGRLFGYFYMESMLVPDYEIGLKNLKEHCESQLANDLRNPPGKADPALTDPGEDNGS